MFDGASKHALSAAPQQGEGATEHPLNHYNTFWSSRYEQF